MSISSKVSGVIFSLFAALFNGTVGVFSVSIFDSGLTPESVAFFKCLIALLIVSIILFFSNKTQSVFLYLKLKWRNVAICSFFGFFVLYHFETAAYESVNVAVVVFCLFGASTITTFSVEALLNKRFVSATEFISMAFAMLGLYFIFIDNEAGLNNSLGLLFAIFSGVGYGLFIVLSKKLNVGAGLVPVFSLLLFGAVYLFFPFAFNGYSIPSLNNIGYLLLLAILPTIGGFWCTTKALTLLKSQSVQLIELTEPIFAICFGAIFLGQLTTSFQVIGGILIMFSILSHEFLLKKRPIKRLLKIKT